MDPHQIALVQTSWSLVEPIAERAADLFYYKLFDLSPSVRNLFPVEMAEQKEKLMQMLGVAIEGLENLDELTPTFEALGRRNVAYDVRDEHYDTVGEALLWTLGQGLGDKFTEPTRAAWTEVYVTLATAMKNAGAHMVAEAACEN